MNRLVWLTVNLSWSHSSLALPLIHGAARDIPGWEWERIEVTAEEDPAALAARIVSSGCGLLCAVLYLFNRVRVMDVLKRVHALDPRIHIAVGGPECPRCDAEKILQENPFLSTVFSGEGEPLFREFLKDFPRKREYRRVIASGTGIWEEWSKAHSPAEDPFFRTDRPFIQIETSRGCPMRCTYCTSAGKSVRFRELSDVKKELENLHAKGVREIRVLDRTFNLPCSRGAELLRMFRTFPDMHFHLEIHPQFLDGELRDCLADALPGQLHLEAGIQSLDDRVQQVIGRKSSSAEALEGLAFLAGCRGFETHADLLAGLPLQTLASLKEDIAVLMALAPGEIQLEVLKMLPGTPILSFAQEYGIIWSPDPPYDVMRTSTMSTEDILESRRLSRLLDLFFNHRSLHSVLCAMCKAEKGIFLRLADSLRDRDINTLSDLKKRFLVLEKFPGGDSPELSLQWILAGFPPDEGPGKRSCPVRTIPPDAVFVSGHPESRERRDSYFRMLEHGETTFFLAHNRSYGSPKPCGLWKVTK